METNCEVCGEPMPEGEEMFKFHGYSGPCPKQPAQTNKADSLNFEQAIENMRYGEKVQRSGWNGKGMFLFLIAGGAWNFETDIDGVDDIETLPFICMKTADNKLVPWLASQTDMLADDWQFVF